MIKLSLLVFTCTIPWSAFLAAQDQPSPCHHPHAPHPGVHGGLVPPEFILQNAKKIGITSEQARRVEALAKVAQVDFRPHHKVMEERMKALQQVLAGSPIDEADALQALDGLLEAEKEIKRLQMRLMVKLSNLLDDDQRQRLAQLRQRGVSGGGRGGFRNSHGEGEEFFHGNQDGAQIPRRLHEKLRQLHRGMARNPEDPGAKAARQLMRRIHESLSQGKAEQAEKLMDEALKSLPAE